MKNENEKNENEKTFKVMATYKDGSIPPYFIYDGWETEDENKAIANAESCNGYWGKNITFEVIQTN